MTESLTVNSQQLRMDESSQTKTVDQSIHPMINGSAENQHAGNQNLNQSNNNQSLNDPVTKAVVDNIMGNLPTKKPFYRCDDCDLSFTSHAVLEAHLQGARHAKQIRSKTIMATLDESKVPFTKDAETNGLQCNVCNVRLNSMQQLHTHLNGNRHKKKALRGGWRSSESETATELGKPSSSSKGVISGKLAFEKTTCKICKEHFETVKLYKKHCNKKKHVEKVKLKKKEKRKRIFTEMYKSKAKTKQNESQTNFESKQPLENFFVSSGYINGTSCEMSDDFF